ncbi:MAG: family transposase [Verrucomicrobiales bacterium]|nr:family transposase [Verrucomicrobiales bacterium]
MFNYKGKTIYMGIDVHKNSYSVSVICDKVLVKRDKLVADPKILLKYCNNFKGAHIKSAYEAGFCGFYLHRFLLTNGIENIVVNPASIEISARDVVKTDKRDSLKIVTQLSDGRLSCIYIPSVKREDKRNLTRLREQFVKQKNRSACQIKSVLHLYGLIEAHTNSRVCDAWLKKTLKLKLEKNCQFRLQKLSETWRYFDLQLKLINKEIAKEAKEDHWLEVIYCSSPGIGPTTARKLINELDDMSQFSNEEKLFSYAGLTPREYSSGDHVRQGHITKKGKPIIRRLLVESAWVAIRTDSSLAAIFERISYKAGKKRAIIGVARILLGRIRTCIKEKRLYRMPLQETDIQVA